MNVDLFKEGGRKEGEKDYLGGGSGFALFFQVKEETNHYFEFSRQYGYFFQLSGRKAK